MSNIKIHDSFFKDTFNGPERVSTFLKAKLPEPIKKLIELDPDNIIIDPNNYIAEDMKEHLSDLVVKTTLKQKSTKNNEVNLYILIEHKSYVYKFIYSQLLRYMHLIWKKDEGEKKPWSIIIPFVFYHGKEKWNIPCRFIDQFDVNAELKEYMLDFQYILFDTSQWSLTDVENEELKKDIELYSALLLFKSAYKKGLEIIKDVFRFWAENGFNILDNRDKILFYLIYISKTKDISQDELKDLLDKSEIRGGEIMPSLAQRLMEEGKIEEQEEIVLFMIKKGFSIDQIHDYTNIDKKRIEEIRRRFTV